jgi:hypothetical protein
VATPLYLGNDYTVTLTALTGGGSALTSATVTLTLLDHTGTLVAGSSVSLSHTSGGTYSGTLESTQFATLSAGQTVTLRWVASQAGYDAEWRAERVVQYRPVGA